MLQSRCDSADNQEWLPKSRGFLPQPSALLQPGRFPQNPFQEGWCSRRITSWLVLRMSSWLKMLFKLGFVGVSSDTTSGTHDDPVAQHVGFALLCFAELLIASEGLWFPLWSLRCHNADRINPEAKESGSVNCCCCCCCSCSLSLVNTMLPPAGAFRVIKNGLHLSNVKCHVEKSV